LDLNDIWQEHKRFILGALAAVVLFFVGKAILGSIYDAAPVYAGVNKAVNTVNSNAGYYRASAREAALKDNEALKAQVEKVRKALEFAPQGDFDLAGRTGSAQVHYLNVTTQVRQFFRKTADQKNVELLVPELGLPRTSPTDRDEMQRVLTSLNLLDEALKRLFAAADVAREKRPDDVVLRAIDKVEIKSGKVGRAASPTALGKDTVEEGMDEIRVGLSFRASYACLLGFLEACRDPRRPFLVDTVKCDVGKDPGDPLTIVLELVALTQKRTT
jgi:hypothetical protein